MAKRDARLSEESHQPKLPRAELFALGHFSLPANRDLAAHYISCETRVPITPNHRARLRQRLAHLRRRNAKAMSPQILSSHSRCIEIERSALRQQNARHPRPPPASDANNPTPPEPARRERRRSGPRRPRVERATQRHRGNTTGMWWRARRFSIGPVFSMAMLVEAGADQHAALTSAVQSAVPGHSVSAHEAEECVEAPAFAAALDVSCADGVGLIARVTEFVANEGLSLSKLETKTEGAPHGGTQLFSLSGVMLSKDRSDRCLHPTSRRVSDDFSTPSTRRRLDGVAVGLSPLVAPMAWRRGSLATRRVDGVVGLSPLGTTHRSRSQASTRPSSRAASRTSSSRWA